MLFQVGTLGVSGKQEDVMKSAQLLQEIDFTVASEEVIAKLVQITIQRRAWEVLEFMITGKNTRIYHETISPSLLEILRCINLPDWTRAYICLRIVSEKELLKPLIYNVTMIMDEYFRERFESHSGSHSSIITTQAYLIDQAINILEGIIQKQLREEKGISIMDGPELGLLCHTYYLLHNLDIHPDFISRPEGDFLETIEDIILSPAGQIYFKEWAEKFRPFTEWQAGIEANVYIFEIMRGYKGEQVKK